MLINTHFIFQYVYLSIIYLLLYVLLQTTKIWAQLLPDEYKIKAQELFKFWTQSKGEHSNKKSEYYQNSDIWM